MDKLKKTSLQLFPEFLDILGTPWEIQIRDYKDDPFFKKYSADGYCSNPEKLIVICQASTDPTKEKENGYFQIESMKTCLRHEIVHAFLYESGLGESSERPSDAWAVHEEMVDWIAQQTTKIFKAFEEAGCTRTITPERWAKWSKFKGTDGEKSG